MRFTAALQFVLILSAASMAQSPKEIAVKFAKDNNIFFYQHYQHLHAHPELSTHETQTAAFLKKELKALGYSIIDSLGYESFAGVMENGKGKTILYRTDMDGLPVFEKTALPYASKDSGYKDGSKLPVMHACGHDLHMSTWLGLAQLLNSNKKHWKGTIIFLAQSAEETGQGAKKVLTTEAFKKLPLPDYQLAIHDNAELETGQIGLCNGYAMAAVDMMDITIYGKGGHGAVPQNAVDPIVIAAQYVNEIQTIVSRNLSPNDPAVITVGAIHGGTVGNIIPDQVKLRLTIRSYSKESRQLILNRLKEIGDHLALAAGLSTVMMPLYELLDMSIPAVYNNPLLGEKLKNIVQNNFGDSAVTVMKPIMIGEDFGVYGQQLNQIPSCILWTGTLSPERKSYAITNNISFPTLHTAYFAPDAELAIQSNVAIMGTCLMELMR